MPISSTSESIQPTRSAKARSKPTKLRLWPVRAAMPAVAITDSSNLFGALEFSQSCTGKGCAAHHWLPDQPGSHGEAGIGARPDRVAGPGRRGAGEFAAPLLARLHPVRSQRPAITAAHRAGPRRRADSADGGGRGARWDGCWRRLGSPRPRRCWPRSPRRSVTAPWWNCTATAWRSSVRSSPA